MCLMQRVEAHNHHHWIRKQQEVIMYIVEIAARSLIPQVWENLGVKETLILHDCVSNQQ